jgi:predicted house-cleaning noncanonical NTP pyrophosphatase (MazG superfamily)
MTVDTLPTYQEIIGMLNKKKEKGKRAVHLLIGNGFSIAYNPSIFSYKALSTFIEDTDDVLLKRLFNVINTKNFEEVMQLLEVFTKFIGAFGIDPSLIEKINNTAETLKKSLIEAVKALHPEHVFTISEEKSASCDRFMEYYLSNNGFVFSSNYDLLLYWVLMRNKNLSNSIDNLPKDAPPNYIIDGFGREIENETSRYIPEEELEYSELRWGKHKREQTIFYLHGTLLLFDTGTEIIKEEYDKGNGDFILKRIEKRMQDKEYPVFVTAGNAQEKLRHIMHNKYLAFCYDKLCSITGSLVTIGFSFSDNDSHIIDAINKAAKSRPRGMLLSLYVGVFFDNDLQHMKEIEYKFKCKKIHYFNAKTANIWGDNEICKTSTAIPDELI